MQIDAAMLART